MLDERHDPHGLSSLRLPAIKLGMDQTKFPAWHSENQDADGIEW